MSILLRIIDSGRTYYTDRFPNKSNFSAQFALIYASFRYLRHVKFFTLNLYPGDLTLYAIVYFS